MTTAGINSRVRRLEEKQAPPGGRVIVVCTCESKDFMTEKPCNCKAEIEAAERDNKDVWLVIIQQEDGLSFSQGELSR